VEANTSHTHAVAGDQVDPGHGLRARLDSLVSPRRRDGEGAANGRAKDETTALLDHYLRDSRAVALHHRHLPGSRREISHLVVGPAGITVVDSHGYAGSPVKFDGGTLRGSARKRSKLLNPVLAQVDAVRKLLVDTPYADVPIEAAMAQRKVSGARVLQGLNTTRIIVCGPRTIAVEASRNGTLAPSRVRSLAAYLDEVLG
jgi:hypothetical protein